MTVKKVVTHYPKSTDIKNYLSFNMDNLPADCSSYAVGFISCCTEDRKQLELFVNLAVHSIFTERFNCSAPDNYAHKFVFSNIPQRFENYADGQAYYLFYKALCSVGGEHTKEHIVDVNGWHGNEFQIRIVEIPKCISLHKELPIDWADVNKKAIKFFQKEHGSREVAHNNFLQSYAERRREIW